MKKYLAIIAAVVALCAVSAVSCGKDVPEDTVSPTEATEMTVASGGEVSGTATYSSEVTKTTKKTKSTKATKEKTTKTTAASNYKGVVLTASNEKTTKAAEETTPAPETTDKPRGNAPLNPASPPPVTAPPATEPEKPKLSAGYGDLGRDMSGITDILHEPKDTRTAQEALPNGADQKIYIYDDIEISSYIKDGAEHIFKITITGGEHSTDKGIRTGSSRAEVEAAYGAGEADGDVVSYSSENKKLSITYSGDKVSAIEFSCDVE